uniref:Protein-tyrosine phosphatase n=1 Tax=Steinernema glaseri TaxID=37863 RepID=A0A1I7Z3Q5_9BILA
MSTESDSYVSGSLQDGRSIHTLVEHPSRSMEMPTRRDSPQFETCRSSSPDKAAKADEQKDDDTEGDGPSVSDSSTSKPAKMPPPAANKETEPSANPEGQRMFIMMRNAEEMDHIFPEWITRNFENGTYVSKDMNQPVSLPKRQNPLATFGADPPLTEMGRRMADLIGRALHDRGIAISAVFSSPALSCIQTTQQLIKSQLYDLKIRVEPALYEFVGCKYSKLPTFMTLEEMQANQIPVDMSYTPIMPFDQMKEYLTESPLTFYERCGQVMDKMVKEKCPFGIVLIVSEACSFHGLARGLVGLSTLQTIDAIKRIRMHLPACTMMTAARNRKGNWEPIQNVVPAITTSDYSNQFDHHFFRAYY